MGASISRTCAAVAVASLWTSSVSFLRLGMARPGVSPPVWRRASPDPTHSDLTPAPQVVGPAIPLPIVRLARDCSMDLSALPVFVWRSRTVCKRGGFHNGLPDAGTSRRKGMLFNGAPRLGCWVVWMTRVSVVSLVCRFCQTSALGSGADANFSIIAMAVTTPAVLSATGPLLRHPAVVFCMVVIALTVA